VTSAQGARSVRASSRSPGGELVHERKTAEVHRLDARLAVARDL
jgi:hypothetical protein